MQAQQDQAANTLLSQIEARMLPQLTAPVTSAASMPQKVLYWVMTLHIEGEGITSIFAPTSL